MGADLYITKLENKVLKRYPYAEDLGGYEERQALREEYGAYFRDSYNATNVMWVIDFSYWHSPKEFGWDFHKNGKLSAKGAAQFLEYLNENRGKFLDRLGSGWGLENYLKERHARVDKGEDSVEGWANYFEEKYERLRKFLQTAIDIHSSIVWSI